MCLGLRPLYLSFFFVFFLYFQPSLAGYVRIDRDILSFSETYERDLSFGQEIFIYSQTDHELVSDTVLEENDGLRDERKELHTEGRNVIGIDLNGYSYVVLSEYSQSEVPDRSTRQAGFYLKIIQQVEKVSGLVAGSMDFSTEIPLSIQRGSWDGLKKGEKIELKPTRDGLEKFLSWYESRFKRVLTSFYSLRLFELFNLQASTHYVLETFAQRWWWGPQFQIEVDQRQIQIRAPRMQIKIDASLERSASHPASLN